MSGNGGIEIAGNGGIDGTVISAIAGNDGNEIGWIVGTEIAGNEIGVIGVAGMATGFAGIEISGIRGIDIAGIAATEIGWIDGIDMAGIGEIAGIVGTEISAIDGIVGIDREAMYGSAGPSSGPE